MPEDEKGDCPSWYWMMLAGLKRIRAERAALLEALEPFAALARYGTYTAAGVNLDDFDFADALRRAEAVYFDVKEREC